MNATSTVPATEAACTTAGPAFHRPWWSLPVVVVAVASIVIAFGFGVHGLLGNPVVAIDRAGVSTLRGTFEPFPCADNAGGCAQGYVRSGGRSVFVVFPHGCPDPQREQAITVRATADRSLGSGGYSAMGCAEGR